MTARINTIYTKKYQPFIKWVGGKRGLLSQLLPLFPKKFENYHEPFLGGGAVFFELYSKGLLKNKKIYLSDINAELINTYLVVKNNPNKLVDNLEEFKEKHNKEFYYKTRELDRKDNFKKLTNIERATRFIYLNKTCFNGLYRVNKKGYFNTPIGSYKNPNIADRDTILSASEALQNSITSSFTAYDSNCFLEDEQFKLFELFEKLYDKEVKTLHSNSNTSFIKNLYKTYDINIVQANRFINSKSSGRGKINEVVIRNKIW